MITPNLEYLSGQILALKRLRFNLRLLSLGTLSKAFTPTHFGGNQAAAPIQLNRAEFSTMLRKAYFSYVGGSIVISL